MTRMKICIHQASSAESNNIAVLLNELLSEIMLSTGEQHFHIDLASTQERVDEWLRQGKYVVFIASTQDTSTLLGFVAFYESYALYAEGAFGTIPEFYVRPEYRSLGIGRRLLDRGIDYARHKDWTRLEVTTPTLPVFERTFRFYEQQGFSISGGRKLKRLLKS